MSFNSSWYLKWVDVQKNVKIDLNTKLVDQCIFYSSSGNHVTGFTVFEPRDFNAAFVQKMEKRIATAAAGSSFELVLAPFLKHRLDALLKKELREKVKTHFSPFLELKKVGSVMSVKHRLRVMSVDDSPVLLKLLKKTMEDLGFIDVVKQVSDSTVAVKSILDAKPDLVTMDIQMPNKNGLEVVTDLLAQKYFPVLMISSLNVEEGSIVFDCLNAGAFDYIQKPRSESMEEFSEELLAKILTAVEGKQGFKGKVVTKRGGVARETRAQVSYQDNLLWVLGASTGGTQALTQVFTSLPASIPPTLVVQHIPPVFSKAFAESLDQLCPFTVKEAENGDKVEKDHVYIAPGGTQMALVERKDGLYLAINDDAPVNRFKPSVDYLFKEAAKLKGKNIVSAIFTGMGKDGAQGMLELKKVGAKTIAQNEASCAVYGMPRAAVELGAAQSIEPLESIAGKLLELSSKETKVKKVA